jgi:hypothetical protein
MKIRDFCPTEVQAAMPVLREAHPRPVEHCPDCAKDFDKRDWTVHTGGKEITAVGEKASTTQRQPG